MNRSSAAQFSIAIEKIVTEKLGQSEDCYPAFFYILNLCNVEAVSETEINMAVSSNCAFLINSTTLTKADT